MWHGIGARTVRAGHVLIVHSVLLKRRKALARLRVTMQYIILCVLIVSNLAVGPAFDL